MSAEKEFLSGVNDGNTVNFDYCPLGRLSPSSWDDSIEERTDLDSSVSVGENDKNVNENLSSTGDRRQSLARVRRRRKSSGSSVFDIDNTKGDDSSESNVESVNCTTEMKTHNYRKIISPNISPIHQKDWDSVQIISDIEYYLREKHFSLIHSKISSHQTNINKYNSVFDQKYIKQREIWEDALNFDSNLNSKLSKMIEVEENKSNTGLRNNESTVKLSPKMDYIYSDKSSLHETQPKCEITNEFTEKKIIPLEYSMNKVYDDSGDSDLQRKIGEKNSEYAMKYDEMSMTDNDGPQNVTLKTQGDEVSQMLSHGDRFPLNHTHVKEMLIKDRKLENCVEVQENSTCIADSSEITMNNNFSREIVDLLGLENLFFHIENVPVYQSTEKSLNYNKIKDDVKETTPCSGREAFLIRESSMAYNVPYIRYSSHNNILSAQENKTDYMKYEERNQVEETYSGTEIPIRRECKSVENSSQKMADLIPSLNSEQLNIKTRLKISNNQCTEVNGNDSDKSSSASISSKVMLHLDLSDDDEECSTAERLIFCDLIEPTSLPHFPEERNFVTQNLLKNSSGSLLESTAGSGNSEVKQSMESNNKNVYFRPTNYDNFGIGDRNWPSYESQVREIDFPQDRGDIRCDIPDTKPCWGNVIMNRERTRPARNKGKTNAFWIDVNDASRGNCRQLGNPQHTNMFMYNHLKKPQNFLHDTDNRLINENQSIIFQKKSNACFFPLKKTKYERIKGRKRKKIYSVPKRFVDDMEAYCRWGENLIDEPKHCPVNSVATQEGILTRGKKWIKTLMVKDRRTNDYHQKWKFTHHSISHFSNKSINCFSNLFRQFVNFFTVSRKSKK